jgi:NADPH:quinone reductase-like Zn-dependent oxidoreductase
MREKAADQPRRRDTRGVRIQTMPQSSENMQAVLLLGHGGPEMLDYRWDVPVPSAGPGEVLISVRAAGVNNTDINTRVGWYSPSFTGAPPVEPTGQGTTLVDGSWSGAAIAFPRIQGADVCCLIVAVGEGISPERIGERVIVRSCLRSLRDAGRDPWLGSELDGGFAQFVRAPSADTYRIECDLSDAQLAAVPCSYGTAENLLQRSHVKAGDRVLITGASGGVGSAAILLARRRGADVIAIAGEGKTAAMRALGATAVVPRGADLTAVIGDEQVDVVIDLVGGPRWPELMVVLKPHGRYAVSGAIAGPIVELDLRTLYLKDLTLLGCTSWDDEVFGNLIRYLERGEIVPLVAATYPPRPDRRGAARLPVEAPHRQARLDGAATRLSLDLFCERTDDRCNQATSISPSTRPSPTCPLMRSGSSVDGSEH